jgi:hypothetical protein
MYDAKLMSPVLLCCDALTMGVRGLWDVRQYLAWVSFDKLTFMTDAVGLTGSSGAFIQLAPHQRRIRL